LGQYDWHADKVQRDKVQRPGDSIVAIRSQLGM